jgi:tetratricopeptide (TPR) repeat protein
MAKQWVRQHEVQRDEVSDFIERSVVWVEKNRQTAMTGGGVLLGALLLGGLFFYSSRANRNSAWERLGMAESLAYAGRTEQSREHLKQLLSEQPQSDAAAFGGLFSGDLDFQAGKYKEAAEAYLKVVERGTPAAAQPLALSNLALAQEAGGQAKEAVSTAQRFLDTFPDHYLAPQAHACLARAQAASGLADQAKSTLQKIVLQYPETSWAAWAQTRLK